MNIHARTFSFSLLNLAKPVVLSLLLALTMLSAGCSDKPSDDQTQAASDDKDNKKDGKDKEDEKAPIPVEVVNVSRGDIQQTYRTITTLEAEIEADVVARSTGILQTMLVEEGDMVEKGQLLAQLDIEQLALEVSQIEATLNKLKNEMDRQQKLFNKKLGSSDALDRARFEHQSQQAQHKLSKLKLNYASIKAPISGIITERMVKQGNLIRDNDLLFKIVDLTSLVAILHLPEKELAQVKKRQKVLLSIDALHDQIVIGEVDRIRPSIDTDTGTFRVVAKVDNSDLFLKSGMFGKVELVFDEHYNTLLLQQHAVITQDNRSHVFVVDGDLAIQTPVVVGYNHHGVVEIIEGLSEQQQVITTGQQILKHQAKIEVVSDELVDSDNTAAVDNKTR